MKILILPDAHAHPEYDNDRFTWLGRLLVDEKPDLIECLGDFADMPSLSTYDRGTKGYEGRRYKRDVQVTLDAQEKLFQPLADYNRTLRAKKKAPYKPRKVITLGNHEDRIDRAANSAPELDGTIGISDLGFQDFGWQVIPFKVPFIVSGIAFCHYFPSGDAGREISGVNVANTLINKNHMSSVVGHNHRLDYSRQVRPDATPLFGLSAGCYAHPDMREGWNLNTIDRWWFGVIILDGVKNGSFDRKEEISMDLLRREYK